MPDGQYPNPRFSIATIDNDPVDDHDVTRKSYVDGLIGGINANFVHRSEAGIAGGYATLDGTAHVPTDQIPAIFVLLAQLGIPSGVATLGGDGQVPTAQLPPAATGGLSYLGQWNPVTNVPVLATGGLFGGAATIKGDYVVVTVTGTSPAIDGLTAWTVGDWAVSTGAAWQKQANSTGFGTMAPQNASAVAITGGSTTGQTSIGYSDGSVGRPGSSMMPDLAWWRRDAAGNIIEAIDTAGVRLIYRLQVLGTSTFAASTFVGNQTITGNQAITGNHSATGTGSFGGAVSLLAIDYPTGDITQVGTPTMPDLARWVRDTSGNIIFGIGTDGTVIANNMQVIGTLTAPGFSGGGGDDPTKFSASLISARDALATAQSMAVRTQTNSKIAQPIWTYNQVIAYGQSLSVGNQGAPRISITEGLDNLTLGTQPAGNMSTTDYTFIPFTDSAFHNMEGQTQGFEMPSIGAINQWRYLQLRLRGLASDSTRRLVLSNCSEGGRSIEELSKGFVATPYYNRIPSLVTQAMAAATLAGGTYGVVAVYYIQGEANYGGSWDHTTAGYQAKLDQLRSDIATDIMAITGQAFPPLFITCQTSSVWDGLTDTCTIGMAQLQAATTAPLGDYMASPNYQAPNSNPNGGHLCNDGYRWIGEECGHILHKIIDKGEGWLPCYPTGITCRGKELLIACHTPEPPLQSQAYYEGATGNIPQPIFADLGFRAGDDFGVLNISSVTLYNSVIHVVCDRETSGVAHPWLQYADNTLHGGNGNVCDSDPFSSLDNATAGVPALSGVPYPMWNWMVAFRINVTDDV